MVKFEAAKLSVNYYSTQSDNVRYTTIKDLLMKIHEKYFTEPHLQHGANKISVDYDSLSRNDRRFLDLIDQEAVKADQHN